MSSDARIGSIAVVVMALVAAATAVAGPPTQATLAADIAKKATLEEGGQVVAVEVTVTCPAGSEVLEAFLYVTQDGNESDFAPIPVVCDSTPHTFVVRPRAFDTPFHKGDAQASGYVLLTSGESISPTRIVKLKEAKT